MRRILFLLIFGILGTGILVSLGVWQMQRLEWKLGVLSRIEATIAAEPVSLPADPDPEADRYLPVRVSGRFLPGEIHVLVSVKQVGAGYRIIAPFETQDGRKIMIDRGFTLAENRDDARRIGAAEVTGNLHWPDEVDFFTPDADIEGNIWFAREVPAMAAHLNTEPVLLIAASETDPGVTPIPIDTAGIPNNHWQYAVTWFSLAVVWVAMTGYFLLRGRPGRATDKG